MDRLETLLDMIEHPDQYTEQQIQGLLKDEDLRKHYDIMVALRMAFKGRRENDDRRGEHGKDARGMVGKIAALFLGVIFMGGLAFAAFHIYQSRQPHPPSPHSPTVLIDTLRQAAPIDSTVRFENTRLDSLLTIVSKKYRHVLFFKDDEPRYLRVTTTWQTQEPLPVFIERMNELDGLRLSLHRDTILVSQPSVKP